MFFLLLHFARPLRLLIYLICFFVPAWTFASPLEMSAGRLRFVFRTSAVASLTYQLDCLAGLIHCEEKVVRAFWKDRGWSAADDQAIRDWAALQGRYEELSMGVPEVSREVARGVGFALRNNSFAFDKKFRMASFLAADLEEYRERLSLLLVPADVEAALKIVGVFQKRHGEWWRATGGPRTEGFTRDFVRLLREKKLLPLIEKIATFYEPEIEPGSTAYFHFFALQGKSNHSSGEQLENHAVVEVLEGELPEERVDVVLHELFHHFYRLAPADKHARFVREFAENTDPASIAAYNLLNEGLATAFGNGLVYKRVVPFERFQKKLSIAKSFYYDDAIDPVAKALLPVLEAKLERGETLYRAGFVSEYIALVKKALGEATASPALALRTMMAIHDEAFSDAYRDFSRDVRAGSVWSTTDFGARSNRESLTSSTRLSAVFLVKPGELARLQPWEGVMGAAELEKLRKLARRPGPFTHVIPRAANAWLFVVVADNDKDMRAQLKRLETARSVAELITR